MLFQKNNQYVYGTTCNKFIYEVFLFLQIGNVFSMVGHEYYSSEQPINYVESVFINKHLEVVCELFSAPTKWLIENEYIFEEY